MELSNSSVEVQMCFLLYKVLLGKSVYEFVWKVQLTKPLKN